MALELNLTKNTNDAIQGVLGKYYARVEYKGNSPTTCTTTTPPSRRVSSSVCWATWWTAKFWRSHLWHHEAQRLVNLDDEDVEEEEGRCMANALKDGIVDSGDIVETA